MRSLSLSKKYGYIWVTLMFFLLSLFGHWMFGWFAYVQEQAEHGQSIDRRGYLIEMARDTFENWQSEFLQLIWQVAGLAVLLCVGSPQSKEGDDRKEEKLDLILRKLDPERADKEIEKIDQRYSRS